MTAMGPNLGSGGRLIRRLMVAAAALAAVLPAVLLPAVPAAAATPGLVWSATIDGRRVDTATPSAPIRLGGADQARIEVTLDNRSDHELEIRSVRLEGRVIGMAFFSYSTRLDVVLPPGTRTARQFDVDITDLTGQATGKLPAAVSLVGPDRKVLDHRDFTVGVAGSMFSVYGAFGLIIAGITAIVLAGLLMAIWRRDLHRNRWQRGIRFLPAGVGIGLVLTFTVSATGLLAPSPTLWLPVVLACAGAAFLLGYLLPGGSGGDHEVKPDPQATVVRPGAGVG
jgi:hypothetical protein